MDRKLAVADRSTQDAAPKMLPVWDRHLCLSVVIAAAVLFPRAVSIGRAHNECFDTDYHLRRGLAFMIGTRQMLATSSTDPPLGQMILALPMWLTGCRPDAEINAANWPATEMKPGANAATEQEARRQRTVRKDIIYGQRLQPETLIMMMALWKTLLFLPGAALIFHWCRRVYGVPAAYLSLALLLVDPTFAANIPIAALDSLGVEALVITCFLYWRYFERETTGRLMAAAVSTAAALLIKHTAVILPAVFALYALYYWIYAPWRRGQLRTEWSAGAGAGDRWAQRRRGLAMALLVGALSLWAMLLFDVSAPYDQVQEHFPSARLTMMQTRVLSILQQRMPAGTYVGCFASAFLISQMGQPAMLFGNISPNGFWYYFPALATFKVPIGIFAVLALALASLWRRRAWPGEHSILIPMIAWLLFLLTTKMNYSFRHFLPAYVFILMWAGRCIADAGQAWLIAAWTAWAGVIAAAAHGLCFHPDYLSYINYPRHRVDLQITDSNLDWGHVLRQIDPWLRTHKLPPGPVYVMQATGKSGVTGNYWVTDGVRFLYRGKPLPPSGTLIIFPAYVCGVYDEGREPQYKALWSIEPIGWVSHAMPVFDLNQLKQDERPSRQSGVK